MTEITHENGIIEINQYGVSKIRFRPCDLDYDSRMALAKGASGLSDRQIAGVVGFLKTQPVEVRQEALEETLGVSFPCGTGEGLSDKAFAQIIERAGDYDE